MRSEVGWLFARSLRRVLVSDCRPRRPFHGIIIPIRDPPPPSPHPLPSPTPVTGATQLLQLANHSSLSETRGKVYYCGHEYDDPKLSNLKIFHWDWEDEDEDENDSFRILKKFHLEDEDEDNDRLLLATNIDDADAEKKFRQAQRAFETIKSDNDSAKMLARARMLRNLGSLDVKLTLEISFMEAVEGCTKTVTFQTEILCRTCGGTGGPPGEKPDYCRPCGGLGKISHDLDRGYETCSFCCGLGYDLKTLCVSCKGERIVDGTKAVKLDLIPGVDDSETIKIQSEGASSYKGNRGDLYVTIKVKGDLVFRRENSDIHIDATIGLVQAIFGGTIQVPTLMGDVDVKVTPGTQPGQMAVIPGKGIKINNSECRGDQYVHFNVKIPENWMERTMCRKWMESKWERSCPQITKMGH